MLNDAKDKFEVDGAAAVISTCSLETEDPLDIGDVADGMHVRTGRLALDARMTDGRVARLLSTFQRARNPKNKIYAGT